MRKRENFRRAFADFDAETLLGFGATDVERLLGDTGIVRHRGKIDSVLNNAHRALALRQEAGSLAAFVWRYVPDERDRPRHFDWATLRALAQTPASTALSTELRRRGWSFVGPTTIYAFMQAVGIVNDHCEGCCMREPVERQRAAFTPPRAVHCKP